MSLFAHILQSFQNLKANPMRAFLSVLGLVIGVLSVTVMVSLGQGLQESVLGEFDEASQNTITLIAGKSFNPFEPQRESELKGFTDTDIAYFKSTMGFITKVTPVVELVENMSITGQPVEDIRIVAGSKEYMDVEGMDMVYGRALTQSDLQNFSNVIVVSENVVEEYLKTDNAGAMGKEILIGDQFFTIVGIIEDVGGGLVSAKLSVIPITTAIQKITADPFYPYLVFEFDENMESAEAVKLVKYNVLQRQGASHIDDALFQVLSTETFVEQIQSVSTMLNLALAGIGGIALLVGGIGVMNIMLVSVTERTREIGIRKAIGAKYKDILLQFLTESVVLGLLGCLIGVLLSWGIIYGLQLAGVPALLNLKTVIIAVLFAGGTGVIFGVGPARKAAKMKPIDALRYE